jgi:hypothetical protein
MRPSAEKKWRAVASTLQLLGAVAFAVMFLGSLVLIGYYGVKRPTKPQPEHGWTVALTWTHPTSYGTAQEENLLLSLHWWTMASFLLIGAGAAIKIYLLDDYSDIRSRPKQPWQLK